jgi:hypothetical protein
MNPCGLEMPAKGYPRRDLVQQDGMFHCCCVLCFGIFCLSFGVLADSEVHTNQQRKYTARTLWAIFAPHPRSKTPQIVSL